MVEWHFNPSDETIIFDIDQEIAKGKKYTAIGIGKTMKVAALAFKNLLPILQKSLLRTKKTLRRFRNWRSKSYRSKETIYANNRVVISTQKDSRRSG